MPRHVPFCQTAIAMRTLLLTLVAHMRWADALVAEALLPAGDAAHSDAVRLFAHVASAEHLWYSRIIGRQTEFAVWPTLTATESRDLAAQNAELYDRLLSTATDGDMARIVPYTNSAGLHFESQLGDIVAHVASHGCYHRGQIALRIRESGQVPPYTDFIQYTRRDQHP